MDKKELRRKVLQLHYDLSGGNSLPLIMRPDVGEKLGIDYNGDELIGTIMYLNEKGFLKSQTNVQESITSLGIDEVENNFPILGDTRANVTQDNELLEMLAEIDEKMELAKKALLLYTELQETQRKAEILLEKTIKKDTELWRDFDKHKTTTYWEKYPSGKYTNETGRLGLWRGFIAKALDAQGIDENKKQQLIQKGQYFTARQIVRNILDKAKSKIDIQDNYLSIEILAMLEEYVTKNPNLSIRMLTQNASNPFKSDLSAFIKQFGQVVEVKQHISCHDRFIIIDGGEVYHSGHSFKDLGSKASLITLVSDDNEKNKFVTIFEDWWKEASQI